MLYLHKDKNSTRSLSVGCKQIFMFLFFSENHSQLLRPSFTPKSNDHGGLDRVNIYGYFGLFNSGENKTWNWVSSIFNDPPPRAKYKQQKQGTNLRPPWPIYSLRLTGTRSAVARWIPTTRRIKEWICRVKCLRAGAIFTKHITTEEQCRDYIELLM